MKKIIAFALLAFLVNIATAQHYQVLNSSYDAVVVSFDAADIDVADIAIDGSNYSLVSMQGFQQQQSVGLPSLPTLPTMIEVPLGDRLTYTIQSMVADTIDGAELGLTLPIAPAQPSVRKSDTASHRLVMDNSAYSANKYCGEPVITLTENGVARSRNLATLTFNPIRWNPVTNQLIIVKRVTVAVTQMNANVEATRRMHKLHANPVFEASLKTINSLAAKDNTTSAPLRYTIVAHSSFRGLLDEFANWKRRIGFIVDLVYTDDAAVGSTTSSIQSYLQGLYDNATAEMPAPTYVLFVGDVAQIPAFYLTAYGESHYSDLSYCCWTGNDNYPDCFYGRFSAQNATQLQPQIDKTLMYEQYTFPDPSYLANAALVAGVDRGATNDNAYKYGDPAMDYVAKEYITADNGFENITYYKNNTSFAPTGVTVTGSSQASGTTAALRNLYNNGCGWVNYTAHGSETSWSDPSFSTSNAAAMTNNNKPMVMIGNCCLTNSFQIDNCFGESLLRKGNNAGAVGYIGASNSTYWTEDFYWTVGVRSNISNTMNPNYNANNLGMYDKLFHTHGEAVSDWHTTLGSMIYAGNWAVESSSSSSAMKLYYWQIYHLMGDPSVKPYLHGEADTMVAVVPPTATIGSTDITVSAAPAYAYISLKDEGGNLLTAAFADANGNATLSFPPLSSVGSFEVAITAQGYRPFFRTVTVTANGPYVTVTSITPSADLTAGTHVNFTVALKNIGVYPVNSFTVELQSLDGSILLDATGQTNIAQSLDANGEYTAVNINGGTVWPNVIDQTKAQLRAVVRWGNTVNDVNAKTFYFTVNSDLMAIERYGLTEFEDNEATLNVSYINRGHSPLDSATLTLLPLDPALSIEDASTAVSNIGINQTVNIDYTLTAVGEIPTNRKVPFILFVDKGNCTYRDTLIVLFGRDASIITFEDNTWQDMSWTQGTYPWTITNQNSNSGSNSLRSYQWGSGNTSGSNKTSEISITWTSTIDDSITFYKNVSSEDGYDKLYFYIDNQEMENNSGTDHPWTRSAYYVPAGTHTFKFAYTKDGSVNRGSDCGWIDDLHMPLTGMLYTYVIDSVCQGDTYTFGNRVISTDTIANNIYQCSDTTANTIVVLTLFVSSRPQVTISASADTIRAGETVRLTASGAENYSWSSGESNPIIDVYPTETTEYTVTGYNGSCSSTASYTIVVDGTIGIHTAEGGMTAIYPNPTHNYINVRGDEIARIVVTDLNGRQIMETNGNGNETHIDISMLPNGIYLLTTIDNNGAKKAVKFIKK